jgi:endonuclease/exonuclease/phosphatase family metal-dependent hydrolase
LHAQGNYTIASGNDELAIKNLHSQMAVLLRASSSPPPAPKSQVRVLTQNCCLLPHYLFQSKGDDNRAQRAELIHRMVQRYDIVLLQEVFSTRWCSQWRELFSNVPGMSSLLTVKGVEKFTDSGLVILSRYPIVKSSFHRFRSKSFTNSVIDRGFLYAAIQVGDKVVHVVNSHYNPNECHIGPLPAGEYRRRQLGEIQAFRNGSGDRDGNWIIGGDFNDTTTVFNLRPMNITFAREQLPTSHSLVPFAIADNGPHLCIDYIASNMTFSYYRRVETLISDHYGVEAGIVLK